ncbi:MAG: M20 family metallopeptidase, partial [Cyanobacteriota bacterium]
PSKAELITCIAIKDKDDKIGIPIDIRKGETLTLIEESGKIVLSKDSHQSFSTIILRNDKEKSELVLKASDKHEFELHKTIYLTQEKQLIFDNVEKIKNKLIHINDYIHANPEIGFKEFKAYNLLTKSLEDEGFIVNHKIANLETAFEAIYINNDDTGPTIGILAEYDALEGMGHACGHNIIAAGAFGAAVALSQSLGDISATIKVYGTPAEENEGGKIIMANEGYFKDCDVILMCHPSDYTTAGANYLSMQDFIFTFIGKSAHSARAYKGISALSAAISFFNGTDSLRQFVRPDARMHGIITYGGDAPNVVPEKTEIKFSIRAKDTNYLKELAIKVKNIAESAAFMSGTELAIEEGYIFESNIVIPLLADLLLKNAKLSGAKRILEPSEAGSTDFGNVSKLVPSECLDIEFVSLNAPCHSHQWVEAANSPDGHNATVTASKAIAATAFDLITRPDLLQQVKDEFYALKL